MGGSLDFRGDGKENRQTEEVKETPAWSNSINTQRPLEGWFTQLYSNCDPEWIWMVNARGDNWPIDSVLIDSDKGLSSITLCSPPFDPANFPVFHYDPHTSEPMVMAVVGREVGGLMDCIVSLRGSICEAHETPSFGSSTAPPPRSCKTSPPFLR